MNAVHSTTLRSAIRNNKETAQAIPNKNPQRSPLFGRALRKLDYETVPNGERCTAVNPARYRLARAFETAVQGWCRTKKQVLLTRC